MERKALCLCILGLLVLSSLSIPNTRSSGSKTRPSSYQTITVDQARALDPSTVIIDLRDADAYAAGHLDGARSLPFTGCSPCFCSRLDPLKEDSLLLYDANGETSATAAAYLCSQGFPKVIVLDGGIRAWTAQGLPLAADAQDMDCHCGLPTTHEYGLGLLHGPTPLPQGTVFTGLTPSSWDWRNAEVGGVTGDWTTPIRNQGQCGSCYAFGCLGALEATMKIASGNPDTQVDLSEQFIVSCGMEWMPDGILGCDGGYFDSTFEFIQTYGSIPESCFPYTSGDGSVPACSEKCSNWEELVTHIDGWHTVASDVTSLKNALVTYGPLTVTMTVYDDFFGYSGGVYEHPGSDPDPTNHMIALVGYDDGQQCWICKNQWGTGWGEDGWFRIVYEDCNIGQEAAYFEAGAPAPASVVVTMHRIKAIGDIEGWLEGEADWSYRIQVNDGHEWSEQVNDDYSNNEDDHTQDVVHVFGVFTPVVEVTIKVWDRDLIYDDLADVSSYPGGGADDDTSDIRGAIFHGQYDVRSNQVIPIDMVQSDGGYLLTSGTFDGDPDSDAENDASVWFLVSDTYTPPVADLLVSGSLSVNGSAGTPHFHLGSFWVKNIGEDPVGFADSYLDWEIASVPAWGANWEFDPDGGRDLRDGQSRSVDVYVDVPSETGTYSGQVKVWNRENHADYGLVSITLVAPVGEVMGGVVMRQLVLQGGSCGWLLRGVGGTASYATVGA